MLDDRARDALLERLQAEVTALRAEVRRPPRRHFLRRALPLALVALLVALVPFATRAATPFTDLQPGSVHNANIDAIFNAGITTGCVPNAQYCPTDTVTRQEMASFLARTAGLGTNPPVANAKTAQTATNAIHATSADTATTATTATHATSADTATTATTATTAGNADTATIATTATTAGNAGTVGGYAPSGLVRMAAASGFNAQLPTINAPIVGATINAPGPGYVLVSATTEVDNYYATGCPCRIRLFLFDITAGTNGNAPDYRTTIGNAPAQGSDVYASLASQWVFPVAAGPRTFQARMVRESGSAAIQVSATLTLTFSPFADAPAGGFAAGIDRP